MGSAAHRPGDTHWDDWLAKLTVYKTDHHDCNVPKGWAENPRLASWVSKQRRLKRKMDRGEQSDAMTAEQVAKLEALGFAWKLSIAAISVTRRDAGQAQGVQAEARRLQRSDRLA
jgi:hypothetical protein